jgi:hypothetical protein
LIRKWMLVVLVLVFGAVVGILCYQRSQPNIQWANYQGEIATFSFPVGWKTSEYSTERTHHIDLKNKSEDGDSVLFSVVEYLPKSEVSDANRQVAVSIERSARQKEVHVENVILSGGIAARSFTTYMSGILLRDADEPGHYSTSYDLMKHYIFTRKNGHVGEIVYAFPENKARVYEPIFRHIVDSLKLRE